MTQAMQRTATLCDMFAATIAAHADALALRAVDGEVAWT